MSFIARQESFDCEHCGFAVQPLEHGSYRNHCPRCLYSKHVDASGPGDRASMCQSLMHPERLDYDGKKGWLIIHVCNSCRKTIPNKAAPDDDITEFEMRKRELGG